MQRYLKVPSISTLLYLTLFYFNRPILILSHAILRFVARIHPHHIYPSLEHTTGSWVQESCKSLRQSNNGANPGIAQYRKRVIDLCESLLFLDPGVMNFECSELP